MNVRKIGGFAGLVALAGIIFITGGLLGSKGVLADQFAGLGFSALASTLTPATQPEDVDFAPVWKVWHLLDDRFVDAYATSTDEVATSSAQIDQDRVWGMMVGLTDAMGDPYTVFLPPSESERFNQDISGSFEGVGMEIAIRDRVLTVVSPLKGTPAYNAGLKSGDKIVSIDDVTTKNMDIADAVGRIRGPKGTPVVLGVVREGVGAILEISVIRDTIQIPTIETQKRADGIFVIELMNFSAKSAGLFSNAIAEFQRTGYHKLIIDLRGNPGGYLDAAVDMASWFLPSGKIVVTEDYGKNGENRVHRSRGYDITNDQLQVVILVDKGSASASEILSGALKEHKAATIIGTNSFGKGSVQEVIPITSDTSLKVTVARWLLAGEVFIGHDGIAPNIEVEIPTGDDYNPERDYILERAVEFLSSGK